MSNFFAKLTGDDGKKKQQHGGGAGSRSSGTGGPPQFRNPFAHLGGANKPGGKNFRGGGQSLGGSKPGRVFSVVLCDPGPLGMKIEKQPNSKTAIVSGVEPNSQAETAGLQRGDIVCHAGSNGEHEIMYDQLVKMAASGQRPLEFDIRRIDTVPGGRNTASTGSTQGSNKGKTTADAYVRKQAVIAAAEARDKSHKAKTKPIPKKGSEKLPTILSTAEKRRIEAEREALAQEHAKGGQHMSEESRRAVEAAKADEAKHTAELGYNPYKTEKVTAGQAATATVAMTHGAVNSGTETAVPGGGGAGLAAPGDIAPPQPGVARSAEEGENDPVAFAFDDAFAIVVTSNTDSSVILSSLGIMRKLIVNATTKGQTGDESISAKFRKVRLSNPKIKSAIADVHGALELMIATGFVLSEEEGETFLVYPPAEKGPSWLPLALKRIEQYEKGA